MHRNVLSRFHETHVDGKHHTSIYYIFKHETVQNFSADENSNKPFRYQLSVTYFDHAL